MPHTAPPAPQRLTWLRWGCTTAMGLSLWCAGAAMAFDLQGHRGARGLAPENTLAGFDRALAIGVSTWVFSALKFQVDMGILLTFMFLVNMLGAILVLPALAAFFWRKNN